MTLSLGDIAISPLLESDFDQVVDWTNTTEARKYFYPHFPDTKTSLAPYFSAPDRDYFRVTFKDSFVGIIGAEQIDEASKKLEMRKLVGASTMRGKGIGKHATFLFLYYAYIVRDIQKVYLHSLDINLRNLNLNGKFGFYLEGVFFEDVLIDGEWHDLVRMALSKQIWIEIYS